MHKLSDAQVKQRLQEGRNYKRLHGDQVRLNRHLKAENVALKAMVAEQQATIETLKIQVTELQTMVFGRKRRPPTGHHEVVSDSSAKQPRTKASYRRPLPPAHAITHEVPLPLPDHCACGGQFKKVTHHARYEEDIPLPELTPDYHAHLVTKYLVERGLCGACGKATAGMDLGGQAVRLGPNIRLWVSHMVSVIGLSYAQVIQLAASLYHVHLTDGEIANLLVAQHQTWLPAYARLKADIRSSPSAHLDETPWPIQALNRQGYAWVMAASNNPKSCFVLASSRGARHAKGLLKDYKGIRITDDYGVYRSSGLAGSQQLCWAHLYRTIRDLVYNQNLPKDQLPYVNWWYGQFAAIYEDLRLYLSEPFDEVVRTTETQELWQRISVLSIPRAGDPQKLSKLKAQLRRAGKDKLFVCLTADIPCDNNRAERDLRGLVLKRKRSFGSKTEKGAKSLSTVLSICMNTWRSNPSGYFKALAAV